MVEWLDYKTVKGQLLADPAVRREYDALEEEFAIASALIEARAKANMTQGQVAAAMGTSQAAVSRMESGSALPSVRSLRRYADATGQSIKLTITPRRRGAQPNTT
jgi:transcriptional regulator with XRE-family HTH domain